MTSTTVLITDMSILAVIFLVGLLPRSFRRAGAMPARAVNHQPIIPC